MAHLRCDFFAESLGLSTSMTVLLPQRNAGIGVVTRAQGQRPPVLYLLHGMSDDDTIWLRRTSIERYVSALGWAVVMPQVHLSFHTDEAFGGRYWTFVSEELPAIVDDFFHVSTRREDTYVAGLSMGGHGAMKLALRQPERFAAAASLSGVLDLSARHRPAQLDAATESMFTRIFGPGATPGDGDNPTALVATRAGQELPALYACCGTEDPLLAQNLDFAQACRDAEVPLTTKWSAGQHDWAYWDQEIQQVLKFFADRRN